MIRVLKDKKFLIFLGIVFVVVAILMGMLVGGAPKRRNQSLKRAIQKVAAPIAKECGLENLEVVYLENGSWIKIVYECDNMSEISFDQKVNFFVKTEEVMAEKGSKYDFYGNDKVAVYSDGNRYTASTESLTKKIYENGEEIDSVTNKVKVTESSGTSSAEASSSNNSSSSSSSKSSSGSSSSKSSSSSNKTSSSTACKGGVSCRAGYHPCHRMSNGYCNQCCKD